MKKIHNSVLKAHVFHNADYLVNQIANRDATEPEKELLWRFVQYEVTSAYGRGRTIGIKYGIKEGVLMMKNE